MNKTTTCEYCGTKYKPTMRSVCCGREECQRQYHNSDKYKQYQKSYHKLYQKFYQKSLHILRQNHREEFTKIFAEQTGETK